MKILFAIKNMNNAKGGAERVLSFVVNGLVQKGYDISLLTFDERGLDSFYKIDPDVKRISLGIGEADQSAGIRETIGRIQAIRRVIEVRQPDIVIPFMHSMIVPVALAMIGKKIPIIASEHIVPQHYRNRKLEFLLFSIASFFVTKITVLSEAVKRLYPFFMRYKMIVVPNPVYIDDEEMGDVDQTAVRKIILNVGRLSDQKNQKTLIRAFSMIADQYPDWDVRIVGEGEDYDFLEELIEREGLKVRIHLIEPTSKIALEYKMAQIFAIPSKYESFGLVTAEAMSFGIPAIGFAECHGTNEIIQNNKNGLLVTRDKNYIENYSKGLEELMKDQDLREKMGRQAKKDIVKFQPGIIVDRWEKVILETKISSNN